jgi:heat shock protein HslJ
MIQFSKRARITAVGILLVTAAALGGCLSSGTSSTESAVSATPVQLVIRLNQPDLAGTSWTLKTLAVNSMMARLAQDNRFSALRQIPEIKFGSGGEFSSFTGVNQMSAVYSIDSTAGELVIGEGALTRMAAMDANASMLEQTFVESLRQVRSYSIIGRELTLYDDQGSALSVYDLR